ncbi:hypothetical protein ACFLS9_00585 [Bacteroidota bacterium]
MKYSIMFIIMITILNPIEYISQDRQTYNHPYLNFNFTASENWIKVHHPEDKFIYEIMRPDSLLHVMLWYTETEQSAEKYLVKMADMKDLAPADRKPSVSNINKKEFWMFNTSGYIGKKHVQSILAVVSHGKSLQRPKENRLYIVHIWCPEENYSRLRNTFDEILASIQII